MFCFIILKTLTGKTFILLFLTLKRGLPIQNLHQNFGQCIDKQRYNRLIL